MIGAAQAADLPREREELKACDRPDFPPEAKHYQLEGTVRLGFDLDPEGVVQEVTVIRSSGWTMMDDAAIVGIARCKFPPELAARRVPHFVDYRFRYEEINPGVTRAAMRPDSCPASPIFSGFVPFKNSQQPEGTGVLVRFLVNETGFASGVAFEDKQWDPRLLVAAKEYIESCRYAPAKRAGVKARGGLSGRLILAAPPAAGQ